MKQAFLKKLCIIVMGFCLLGLYIPRLSADQKIPFVSNIIDMVAGDIQTVTVNNLTRVSVTNPEVADISDAQSDKISLLAKKAGETVLFLWDGAGKRSIKVRVVNEDLSTVKARVQKILQEANISGITLEENLDVGKVVVSGNLSKEDKNRVEDVLQPYSENLLNLVKVEKSEDLIEVDMQVVEISTTLVENLGIQWGAAVTSSTGSGGSANASSITNSGSVLLNYNETLPSFNGKIGDFFKIGNFARTTPLEATVNALLQEGKARLISKPRLVVVSGKQASFLVGGEIPISNTTSNTTGSTLTENTTYAQYGVNMTVTPTIREGKIDVLLNVDIRDIDSSTPLTSGNGNNVAFITRTASTDLLMNNRQTVALAGLIRYSDSVQDTKVPYLSKIPLLGLLFRSRNIPHDSNTETIIILTPSVLTNKKFADQQVVMPTPAERDSLDEIDAKYEHEPLVDPGQVIPNSKPITAPTAVTTMTPTPKGSMLVNVPSAKIDEITTYARMVHDRISKFLYYPKAIDGNRLSGTVKLKLHILQDGLLDSVVLTESSGSNALDQDALQAAKKAAPYDAFTPGMKQEEINFMIPIVYSKADPWSQASAEKTIASHK